MPHEPSAGRALIVALICLVPLLAVRAGAAALDMPSDYRHAFEAGGTNGAWGSGLAVGLIDGSEQAEWFFGKGSGAAAPGHDSAFEIGAATDVFTGLLVAQAVLEGKLRLAWRIRDILPADVRGRDPVLSATTIADLVTQQSLLPSGPANLFPGHADDPYADYRDADLLAWQANVQLPAGAGPGYSILNGGLLGVLLARVYGGDYAGLVQSRVLGPLGMAQTGFDDTGLLTGYAFGQPTAHWHFQAFAGAAGLRSTVGDLLGFVRANLRPDGSSLRAALLLARQARTGSGGGDGGIGFGWNVHEVPDGQQTWPLVWRASVTGGFSTFIGFRTDRQRGLVLLAASATELAPIGLAWLSGEAAPGTPAPPYLAPAGRAERYPGLYRLLDGSELTVRSHADVLSAQLRGQPGWPLFPIADDVYATSGGAALLTFVRNVDEISGLVLRSSGAYVTARRLSKRAPVLAREAIALDAGLLDQYDGDFTLDAGLQLRVTHGAAGLVAHYTGTAPLPMHAYARDRFADDDGGNELLFRRDAHGRISAVGAVLAGAERTARPVDWQPPRLPAYTAPVPPTEDAQE